MLLKIRLKRTVTFTLSCKSTKLSRLARIALLRGITLLYEELLNIPLAPGFGSFTQLIGLHKVLRETMYVHVMPFVLLVPPMFEQVHATTVRFEHVWRTESKERWKESRGG